MSKVKKVLPTQLGFWERNKRSHNYLVKHEAKRIIASIIRTVLLFGLCFLILEPVITKLALSVQQEQDLYDNAVILIPKHFTGANYRLAISVMDYWSTLGRTFLLSASIAVVQLVASALVAYGFGRFDFPFKKFWFALVIFVIIIPPQTISTALYMNFRYFDILGIIKLLTGTTINLRGSILPYYMMSLGCMGLKQGLYIFLLRQMFRDIPKELEEAAYVDGCGPLRTFVRVMLPNAVPTMLSCFLFSFVWQWTDGFYNQLFLGNSEVFAKKLTGFIGILNRFIQGSADSGSVLQGVSVGYGNMMLGTGILLAIAPLIILYLFIQRGFIESLSSTGIKM